MKRYPLVICTTVLTVALSTPAQAAVAVVDFAAITQAIKQVTAWREQSSQMLAQIGQARDAFNSMTGRRGMELIMRGARSGLPPDLNQALTRLTNDGSRIRSSQSVLSPSRMNNLAPELRQFVDQNRTLSAGQQSMAQAAYNDAALRESRLRTLNDKLAVITDPKESMDLANAISIERAGMESDHMQLVAVANNMAAQTSGQQNMLNEMRTGSAGTGSFPRISMDLPW